MNRITVSGRLVNDPAVRYTPKGKIVCSLTLAVQRDYANSEGVYEADFIPIIFFEKSAEIAGNNLSKGKKILVDGQLKTRHYATDSGRKYVTEIIGKKFEYMYSKENDDLSGIEVPEVDMGTIDLDK